MKTIKRKLLPLLLALVMLLGMVPANAAGSFSDISDMTTAQNVEVLQMMGVVDGMSGSTFVPNGTLTRAQFCKMAVAAMGQGDRANIYKNYTIFPDVKPGHWAAGYINLAVRSEPKLIAGLSDGTFGPNRTLTYGQAITILMRMLGYTDQDVSVVWPDGYIDQALAIGLSDGVSLSGSAALSRAQAAQLFVNLLNTKQKSGGKFYTTLGDAVEAVLLNANAKDTAGNAVMLTSAGEYVLAGNPGSGLLAGRKGVVILNDAGEAVTFIPSNEGSSRGVTIAKADATTITDTSGVKYTVAGDARVYLSNEPQEYAESFSFLRAGTLATLYISSKGRVETVFVGTTTSDDAVVVARDGSTDGFSMLTDRTDYKLYKHGEEIKSKDLRKYDVATYSASNNVIYVSDNRMTVYYQNAYPNTAAPSRVKATGIIGSGAEGYLEVLPCAMENIGQYRIGQAVTLLLTENNKVAGMVDSGELRGNAIGFVSESGLQLFNGLTVDKTAVKNLDSFKGQLVTVTSYTRDTLALTKLTGRGANGDLDVAERTVGGVALAGNVRIYERAGASELTEVTLDMLPDTVTLDKIVYAHKNELGKIDILLLENAAGAGYIYGRIEIGERTEMTSLGEITNKTVTVHYGNGASSGPYLCNAVPAGTVWAGIIPNIDGERVTDVVALKAVKNVSASSFRNTELVYHNGAVYQVSGDVVCYNSTTRSWVTLGTALAFGGRCTLYIDGSGVVRGVEVSQ